jgi:hypothetical protein
MMTLSSRPRALFTTGFLVHVYHARRSTTGSFRGYLPTARRYDGSELDDVCTGTFEKSGDEAGHTLLVFSFILCNCTRFFFFRFCGGDDAGGVGGNDVVDAAGIAVFFLFLFIHKTTQSLLRLCLRPLHVAIHDVDDLWASDCVNAI